MNIILLIAIAIVIVGLSIWAGITFLKKKEEAECKKEGYTSCLEKKRKLLCNQLKCPPEKVCKWVPPSRDGQNDIGFCSIQNPLYAYIYIMDKLGFPRYKIKYVH